MKQNLSALHVIQHVYFGKVQKENLLNKSRIFINYRLAFLPIYFTAQETGRYEVINLNKSHQGKLAIFYSRYILQHYV